jgi:hypothetical protein
VTASAGELASLVGGDTNGATELFKLSEWSVAEEVPAAVVATDVVETCACIGLGVVPCTRSEGVYGCCGDA